MVVAVVVVVVVITIIPRRRRRMSLVSIELLWLYDAADYSNDV